MPGEVDRPEGVVFPALAGAPASTMTVNRAVFADAARSVSPALAAEIDAESNWRGRYRPYVRRLLELGLQSPENAVRISADGLAGLHERLRFRRDDVEQPVDEAIRGSAVPFGTATVRGQGHGRPVGLTVSYRGHDLSGTSLRRQVTDWVARGIAEPSFGEAINLVIDNPDWLDLGDHTVAVLGAGAELAPLAQLCGWGARIMAMDLPRPEVWQRVLATALESNGTVLVPVPPGHELDGRVVGAPDLGALADVAGANLITHAPEVRAWLAQADAPLTVGNYVYADGGTHVRASVAIDAVMTGLQADRDDVTLAFLATPTDVFSVPWDAVVDARARYANRPLRLVEKPFDLISGGRLFHPHYADAGHSEADPSYGVADNLISQQGPNYALAKRMQRWRATIAREVGVTASLNIAPPTRTRSVVKNRSFALAYAGMSKFGLEVFDPPASNTLMAAMLVHDLRNPASSAHPGTPLAHPLDLFIDGANPGGMWRCPYEPTSILTAAAVAGLFERRA
jgi:hypothetical protein